MTVGCRTGVTCAGCDRPIHDRYLLNVMERTWHSECVQCSDCRCKLTEKCFSREGNIYCKDDFYRRFGTKCAGCSLGISPSDLVRKAKDKVFHLKCFTCMVCRKQLSTGEELYVVDDDRFMCKSDYCRYGYQGSNDDDGDCEDIQDDTGSLQDMEFQFDTEDTESIDNSSDYPEKPNMNVSNDSNEASFPNDGLSKLEQAHDLSGSDKVSEDPLSPEDLNDSNETKCSDEAFSDEKYLNMDENSNDESVSAKDGKSVTGSGGSKRRGPRTTIKAKQLEVLKAAFAANPKPTRHIREQLAKDTGLNMRVIQVWFQNRRSKERRMKQLSIFGNRRNFFNSRRMRGMSLEDGPDVMGPPHMGYFPENERDYFGYDGYGDMFPPHGPEGPQGMGYLPPNAHRIPPMGMNQQLHSPLDHSPDGRYLPENMLPPSSTEQQMHMHPSEMILSSGDTIRTLPGRPLFSQPLSHRTEGLGEAW